MNGSAIIVDRIENHETISLAEAGEIANGMRTKSWSYIRLSTPDQIAGQGEERQLDAAAAYAKAHGLDLQPPLKDLGVSAFKGKHRKSGKLKLFLTMIEIGHVPPQSYFLVENCDRLSREDPLIAFETFTAIINAGINVVTTDDGQLWNRAILLKEPMRLMMWIMSTIRGNAESKRKSEMVTKAARKRLANMREAGKALSGRVPTWLRKREGGGYEVDPIKEAVLHRIFVEFDQGFGATRIANRLNADGIEAFNDYKRATAGWHGSLSRLDRRVRVSDLRPDVRRERQPGQIHEVSHRRVR